MNDGKNRHSLWNMRKTIGVFRTVFTPVFWMLLFILGKSGCERGTKGLNQAWTIRRSGYFRTDWTGMLHSLHDHIPALPPSSVSSIQKSSPSDPAAGTYALHAPVWTDMCGRFAKRTGTSSSAFVQFWDLFLKRKSWPLKGQLFWGISCTLRVRKNPKCTVWRSKNTGYRILAL